MSLAKADTPAAFDAIRRQPAYKAAMARGAVELWMPELPQNPRRKRLLPFDKDAYKARNIIERAFSHLKDWRRVATRYDKLARNYTATVILAAIVRWWA
jgi:putative transposase